MGGSRVICVLSDEHHHYDTQKESYRLTAVAQDQGFPPLSRTVEVQIEVVDRANNPPVWTQSIYGPIYIKENLPVGAGVISVKARLGAEHTITLACGTKNLLFYTTDTLSTDYCRSCSLHPPPPIRSIPLCLILTHGFVLCFRTLFHIYYHCLFRLATNSLLLLRICANHYLTSCYVVLNLATYTETLN